MSGVDIFPWHTASSDAITIVQWRLAPTRSSDVHVPLPDVHPAWDETMDVSVTVELSINVPQLVKNCGLLPSDQVRVALTWHSTGTGLRGCGDRLDLSGADPVQTIQLGCHIEGENLADRVELDVRASLISHGRGERALAASQSGSFLWASSWYERRILLLEGEGARFPVSPVDFETSGIGPPNAAWYLDWTPTDFSEPALGAFRLYVNTRHNRVVRAIEQVNPDAEAAAIREGIRFDIARLMITGALDTEDFEDEEFSEESEGAAVVNLIRMVFPHETIESLRTQLANNPGRFEAELQSALKLYWIG